MVIAYNMSANLKAILNKTDELKTKLLLLPLSPKNELRLRWETTITRIYWSLSLSGSTLTGNQILKLLSVNQSTKIKKEERIVFNYKNALSYINGEWRVSGRPVSLNTIKILKTTLYKSIGSSNVSLENNAELNSLLEYLNKSTEHPILQAGIAQIGFMQLDPIDTNSGHISKLLPYIYLYKQGYDLRCMLVLEEFFRRDLTGFNMAIASVKNNKTLTLWLEYFAYAILTQLEKAYKYALDNRFVYEKSSNMAKLNIRQREILDMLENPEAKISNKIVQEKFKISQITASRDLAKLLTLNLIFVYGKGRSTYYTRS